MMTKTKKYGIILQQDDDLTSIDVVCWNLTPFDVLIGQV